MATSTINKTGEDYNTLELWEDDVNGDLVTETRQETAEVYDDDGALQTELVIDGSTTNSTYYMKVTVPSSDRHNGTASSGARLYNDWSSGTGNNVIYVLDNYTVIEWLVVEVDISNLSGYWDNWSGIRAFDSYVTIRNNVVFLSGGSIPQFCNEYVGIGVSTTDGTQQEMYVYDNIVYNFTGYEADHQGIGGGIGNFRRGHIYFYNNTVSDCSIGIKTDTGTSGSPKSATVRNNRATGNTVDFVFDTDFASYTYNYNISEDTSATDQDATFSHNDGSDSDYVDATNKNFKLASGAAGIGEAVDLGTSPSGVQVDILGRDRDSEGDTWDLGAHQYVDVGTTFTYSGSLSIVFTNSATINVNLVYLGNLSINFVVLSETKKTQIYSYVANLGFSFVPSSVDIFDFSYVSSLSVNFNINSNFVYQEVWQFTGTTSVVFSVSSSYIYQSVSDFVYSGNLTINFINSFVDSFHKVYDGNLNFNVVPSSTDVFDRVYLGTTDFSLVPVATYSTQDVFAYAGDVTINFVIASNIAIENVYIGDISFSLVPSSIYLTGGLFDYIGNLTVSFVPSSQDVFDFSYTGNLPCVFSINSGSLYEQVWSYETDLNLSFIPNSLFVQTQGFLYVGNSFVNLVPLADIQVELVYISDNQINFIISSTTRYLSGTAPDKTKILFSVVKDTVGMNTRMRHTQGAKSKVY